MSAPDLCECGHGRDAHSWMGCWSYCPCTAYRPAPTPQPDYDSGLTDAEAAEVMASVRSADVPPSSPPRRVRRPEPTPQPEPTGLVERVAGYCPACGRQSLFLGAGGYVTCARLQCPDPCAATDALAIRREIGETT